MGTCHTGWSPQKDGVFVVKARRNGSSFLVAVLVLAWSTLASAMAVSAEDQRLFDSATSSLLRDAPTEAIGQFELLADRGAQHPDISFNRALAYLKRSRSPQAKAGDLGRAACALSEALILNPVDESARVLLDQVDHELSRARSRRGAPSLLARARLSRAIVGLVAENTWAIASLLFSLVTTLGLLLRLGTKTHRMRLSGSIALFLGASLGALCTAGLWLAMQERQTTLHGVVVSEEARLLDVTGAALPRAQLSAQDRLIPEGARVLIRGRTDRLIQVEWGNIDAYVSPTDIQILPRAK